MVARRCAAFAWADCREHVSPPHVVCATRRANQERACAEYGHRTPIGACGNTRCWCVNVTTEQWARVLRDCPACGGRRADWAEP
jgi:hypothetical protein